MAESRTTRIIYGIIVLFGLLLVSLYLLSIFKLITGFGTRQIGTVFFIIIVTLLLFLFVFIIRRSVFSDRIELGTIIAIASGILLVYFLIKFPSIIPLDFRNAIFSIQEFAMQIPPLQAIIDFSIIDLLRGYKMAKNNMWIFVIVIIVAIILFINFNKSSCDIITNAEQRQCLLNNIGQANPCWILTDNATINQQNEAVMNCYRPLSHIPIIPTQSAFENIVDEMIRVCGYQAEVCRATL